MRARGQNRGAAQGFTIVELMVVVAVVVILLVIAVPTVTSMARNLRLVGDTRIVAAQLALARMRAASAGTKVRLNFNLTAGTYQIELWSKSASAYQQEGGVQNLSSGDSFGYGSVTTPAGQQSTIAQTSPIYFNSRGIATDSSGNATASSVIYLSNNQGGYSAVAVSIAGQPMEYRYIGSAWVAF